MARIAFVQNLAFEYMGVMHISSVLKKNGHSVEVFIGNNLKRIAGEIKNYGAELVGFPCTTANHRWCLEASRVIKIKTRALTVFGGPHPTFLPEIILESGVDVVCRGEAEMSVLELANKLDNKDDIAMVPNHWFKVNGRIVKNELRPLIENLDSLPFPDRDIYYKKYPFLNRSQKSFIAGRGCPFKCSYCFNESMQALYNNKGRYIRQRSVANVLEEIKHTYNRYGMRTVYMMDDTFILNAPWVYEFLDRYAKEIALPLICLVRADLLTAPIVKRLKKAKCHSVFFGIESGNERLRNIILGKRITDGQIITAARLLKEQGIKFRTYNMMGIPGETLEDALETVKLNIRIKTDYPWCSLLQPYPKTKIEEYARSNNLLVSSKIPVSSAFFGRSIVSLKNSRETVNLQKLFVFAIKFPSLLSVIKRLIRFPPNALFNLLFLAGYAFSYRKSENLRLREFISIGLKNLNCLLDR